MVLLRDRRDRSPDGQCRVAGNARKETEKELERSIVSPDNFLPGGKTPDLLSGDDKTEVD